MNKSKEKRLIENIQKIIQDLITNESSIILKKDNQPNKYNVLSYSKTELGGDSVQIIKKLSDEIIELDMALRDSTMKSRMAIYNFISKALS